MRTMSKELIRLTKRLQPRSGSGATCSDPSRSVARPAKRFSMPSLSLRSMRRSTTQVLPQGSSNVALATGFVPAKRASRTTLRGDIQTRNLALNPPMPQEGVALLNHSSAKHAIR